MRPLRHILTTATALAALTTQSVRADDEAPLGERRDTLLMLDSGPVHIRTWVSLDGKALSAHVEEYVDRLMRELDADGDGRLSKAEARRSPLRASARQRGNPFLEQLDKDKVVSRGDIEQDVLKVFSDYVTYRQDDSAATNDGELFGILDSDDSQFIEPGEMRTAALRILDRDSDRDQCVTLDELAPAQQNQAQLVAIEMPVTPTEQPPPRISDTLRDGADTAIGMSRLIGDVFRKYDRNRDRRLSIDELGWDPVEFGRLDRDKDGGLSSEEALHFPELNPSLELAIELTAGPDTQPVRILASRGVEIDQAPRPDLIRVKFGEVTVTFSSRDSRPIQDAEAAALRVFNETDLDMNGYLDKEETSERDRFERGLFEEMDADGDGKLFSDEMRAYVAARAEPAAITCRVNVYNTGFGFFQILDASGDGRISVRELRAVENTLRSMVRGGESGLAQGTTGRNLHVEFVRNTYKLFGPAGVTVAQQATEFVPRPPVGPDWFRAMDRNSDGDLTFGEFIGLQRDFELLDADGDGLIDYREAERADELFPLKETESVVRDTSIPSQRESADPQPGAAD